VPRGSGLAAVARELTGAEVCARRLRSQRLVGRLPAAASAALAGVFAIQAQDTKAARLGVRVRSQGVDAAAVTRACGEERTLVRTWAMRGTLHLLAAADVRWVVGLLGPLFARRNRRRRLEVGLDDDRCRRALRLLPDVLGGAGPLSREELVRRLAAKRLRIDAAGQAPAHLLFLAAQQGLICRGPDLAGDKASYVLLEEWLGAAGVGETRSAAASWAELARRHLSTFAPAGVEDFAAWSGAPAADARQAFAAIAGELTEVRVDGKPAWQLTAALGRAESARGPSVCLLPAFDSYLLGYRSRAFTLAPRFASRIQGGGWILPVLLVDGRVAGTWRAVPQGRRLVVQVRPFERLMPAVIPRLEAEARDVGRFLARETTLDLGE
jgi:hypothetical protein